ncbi:MAG: hypothetical protein ACOYO1_00630 [Bacteroidales bacterium]
MGKAEVGAQGTDYKSVPKCSIESIKIKPNENEISIFILEDDYIFNIKDGNTVKKPIYLLTNNAGKKIPFEVIKINDNNCTNPQKHNKNYFIDATSNNEQELTESTKIKFEKIKKDFSFLYNYFFLPIPISKAKPQIDKLSLIFTSCKNDVTTFLIPYPDLKFEIALGLDFETDDKAKKESNYKKFDKNYSFSASCEFNEPKETISFSLSHTSPSKVGSKEDEIRKKLNKLAKLAQTLTKTKRLDRTLKEFLDIQKVENERETNESKLEFSFSWEYATSNDLSLIGRNLGFNVSAKPLFGITYTINLLEIAGNAIMPGLGTLIEILQNAINSVSKDYQAELFLKLVLSGDVSLSGKLKINTVELSEDNVKLDCQGKVSAKLKAGVNVKAKKVHVELSGEGSSSITAGGSVKFSLNKLIFSPYVIWDGLKVEYVFVIEVNLTKKWNSTIVDYKGEIIVVKNVDLLSLVVAGVDKIAGNKETIDINESLEFVLIDLS